MMIVADCARCGPLADYEVTASFPVSMFGECRCVKCRTPIPRGVEPPNDTPVFVGRRSLGAGGVSDAQLWAVFPATYAEAATRNTIARRMSALCGVSVEAANYWLETAIDAPGVMREARHMGRSRYVYWFEGVEDVS